MIVTLPANGPLVLMGKKDKLQEVWFQVIGAEAEAEVHLDERGLVIIIHVKKETHGTTQKATSPTRTNERST